MPSAEHRDHDHTRWLDFLRAGFAEVWEDVFLTVMADAERGQVGGRAREVLLREHQARRAQLQDQRLGAVFGALAATREDDGDYEPF